MLGLSHSAISAADYYVSPTGNDDHPGTLSQPFKTIKGNFWRLKAGDNMILRGGVYEGDRIYLGTSQSGTASSPITFKAYQNEKPVLNGSYTTSSGAGAAISLNSNNNYIVFDGINIHNVYGHFVYMDRSHHITIKNCEFKNADGNWMGVYLNYASYVTMQNCVLDEVSDNTKNENVNMIHVEGSHHNLFENLTITRATHSLIDFQNSHSNVIRNNILKNDWQKNTGIAAPYTNKVGRNIYDNNEIYGARTALTNPGKGAMGIYINQSSNIVRRNRIYDNQNFGILMNSDNAFGNSHITHNKVYNNTFYNNGYLQGYSQSSNITITDFWNNWNLESNIFKNNIIVDGVSQNVYVQSLRDSGLDDNVFAGNCMYKPSNPNAMMEVVGIGENNLSWFQNNYPSLIYGNTETNPNFLSASGANFTLNSNSGCIDKGVALTTTRSSGSGTTVPVVDAGYFTDGMGIISGDIVRVGTQEVRVTGIDYTNNTLTVDRSISWSANAAVNLPYAGNAPDPGAHETGFSSTPLPSPSVVPTPSPAPTLAPLDNDGLTKLTVSYVSSSSTDGTNVPSNTIDGNLSTRWSACGVGEWIKYDLGSVNTVGHINMAFYVATTQIAKFDIELSTDDVNWTKVFSGQSSNTTLELQKFDFTNTQSRYVRIVGLGNLTSDQSCWNSYTEVEIYGNAATPSSTPITTSSSSSWFSTLDSNAAITSPLVGGSGRLSGATLGTGKTGLGVACNGNGQHLAVTTANHFTKAKGTVEFWFKPNWNHTNNVQHTLFQDSTGAFNFLKQSNNELKLVVTQGNSYPEVKISPSNYSLVANTWYKVRIHWNDQAPLETQLRIFINDVEPTHTDSTVDLNSTQYNFGSDMVFCTSGGTNTNATVDEIRISKEVSKLKPGDANEDNNINGVDYVKWLNNFGSSVGSRHFGGDFNYDGLVNGQDYVLWLNNFLAE